MYLMLSGCVSPGLDAHRPRAFGDLGHSLICAIEWQHERTTALLLRLLRASPARRALWLELLESDLIAHLEAERATLLAALEENEACVAEHVQAQQWLKDQLHRFIRGRIECEQVRDTIDSYFNNAEPKLLARLNLHSPSESADLARRLAAARQERWCQQELEGNSSARAHSRRSH